MIESSSLRSTILVGPDMKDAPAGVLLKPLAEALRLARLLYFLTVTALSAVLPVHSSRCQWHRWATQASS